MKPKIKCFINQFGLPQALNRPHIPVIKSLDLLGDAGRVRIEDDTQKILKKFASTFEKLKSM